MTGSTAHLRRDFLAGHWGNVRGLFWDKVRSRLLDGVDLGYRAGNRAFPLVELPRVFLALWDLRT